MIDDTESNVSVGSASGESAGEAALIATFYGPRRGQAIENLYEQLYRGLAPKPRGGSVPYGWENREDRAKEIFGRRFDPPGRAAADTTVVQIALNAPHNAAEAWKTMRQDLENILIAEDLSCLWGYTLVYQAVTTRGTAASVALEESLWAIGRLGSSSEESMQPLASDKVAGGRVWLLGIPEQGDGLKAGTVYCALGPPKAEEALLDLFYGPAAKLFTPDLIAHKGYYQMRQYRGEDLERSYEKRLQDLRQITADLLQQTEQGTQQTKQGEQETEQGKSEGGSKLDQLSQQYYHLVYHLVPAVSGLKELHVGVLRQLKNYDLWQEQQAVSNGVVGFHRDQLEAAAAELDLIVQPLKDGLDTADKAVSLAQVQETKNLERILAAVTAVLATVTLILATVEIITWHVPNKLSEWALVPRLLLLGFVFITFVIIIKFIIDIIGWRSLKRLV